jgi:hypothetical protein
MKYFRALTLALVVVFVGTTYAHAGTIDPRGVGNWKAIFENAALSSTPTLNFGKFTTQSAYNITVSDTELRGYAWGEGVGWIVMNCADTTSGCSGTNGNFKVANDGNGNLSGYAWGENTGWINFGPFTNPAISTVKITSGFFGGPSGSNTPGYAWAQNYGWIKFDCASASSCVETDWGTSTPSCSDGIQNQGETGVDTGGPCGGGGPSGGLAQCRDGKDNDGDGLVDRLDPGCHTDFNPANDLSYTPNDPSETNYQCSDGIDNDNDRLIDYTEDPGCAGNPNSDSEVNTIGDPTIFVCSDRLDNDNDGLFDYQQDPGCNGNPLGDSEVNTNDPTEYICSNGNDDDNDDLIDWPADPGCVSAFDMTEENAGTPPGDPTPSCRDGVQNQGETGIDTGGPCGGGNPPSLCDQFPTFPTCVPPGPGNPGGPSTPVIPTTPGNPVVTFLTWLGLSLPIASAIVSFVVSNPIALKDIPLLLAQLWNSILIALGWKERKKPWGVVYDSVTKQPIDPAYVVLMDMQGNEIATAITDMNGRYGFAVDPGTYRIVVNKTNYQFPSTKLAGKTDDGLYDELYFGGDVVVSKQGEIITKNIPLDALAFDWNEYTKAHHGTYTMKLAFYRTADIVLYHLSRILFMLGFAYSIYAFLFSPIVFNAIILALYISMAFVQMFAPGFHKKGSVLGKQGKKPLPFSVVRIISAVTSQEVAHKVADRVGNYYGLIQNGLYTFTVDTKKQFEEGYDKHPVDKYVKVKKGYLKETFKV